MMRSLRWRIVLTVWPLFVVAILGVGALSSRSARIELAQFESRSLAPPGGAPVPDVSDSVVAAWPTLRGSAGQTTLQRLTSRVGDSLHLLVLDTSGTIVASSDPSIRAADVRISARGDIDLTRSVIRGRERQVQRLMIPGSPLVSADRETLGYLYVLPGAMPRPTGAQLMVAGIERSLWLAVLLACLLAAGGTWVLAGPIVAQLQRLTAAASSMRTTSLATRVRVSSRDEIGALEQAFNGMAESLERTEAARKQLISDLAHELRTPLTNIIGLLEAMRDGLRPADATTLLSTQEEALLLQQLIDELQDLALADAGGLSFDLRTLDARAEVQRAVDAFQASRPAIQIEALDEHVAIVADSRRLAQVLRNLLQNAITHTPADGNISVGLRRANRWIVITVSDTGRGIAAEHLPMIWDRFYRVDPSRDRATGGMGLGLALVRRMVEGMGGTVSATSQLGVGTTVAVTLPG